MSILCPVSFLLTLTRRISKKNSGTSHVQSAATHNSWNHSPQYYSHTSRLGSTSGFPQIEGGNFLLIPTPSPLQTFDSSLILFLGFLWPQSSIKRGAFWSGRRQEEPRASHRIDGNPFFPWKWLGDPAYEWNEWYNNWLNTFSLFP